MTYDQTVEDLASEYVDALNAPSNGWGQHMTKYGQSHHMLAFMSKKFGTPLTTQAIKNEFKARREKVEREIRLNSFVCPHDIDTNENIA